ncbi:kinase-like domain-containing protein [Rhizophagus irregularis DAOM 181602=DAOM 197198]|nr:kinase-like domain-containing protein [Rhizophagus irregularis DAOM 181602=DAOM 197198]
MNSKENLKSLWKKFGESKYSYQEHVTISTIDSMEEPARKVVCINDLKKRKRLGGFGKVYSANWAKGFILYWDIEGQKWERISNVKVALKSLNNSSHISTDFLDEIKSHLQIYLYDVIQYLITKCWDAKVENRPTAKELYQALNKWVSYGYDNIAIYSQMNKYDDVTKLNRISEKKSENIQTHPQAIYTSRLLNFKNLPEPVNSDIIQSIIFSEDFDLDESVIL